MAWDESKHPRAPDGKFGQGGGSRPGHGHGGSGHEQAKKAWAAAAVAASKPKTLAAKAKGSGKVAAAKESAAKAKAKIAAAKAKAKDAAARIIASAKVKAGQIKWKVASDVAKKTAALKAGKVVDPKAARAAIAAAKKAAAAKVKAVMDSAKARAAAKSAAILAKAGAAAVKISASTSAAKTAQTPTASGKPMSDHDLESARQRVQATATSHELSAAMIYSGHSYEQINGSLRTGQFQDMGLDEARLNQTIGHLDTLMDKSRNTESTLTYRGSAPHPSFANLKPGQVFVDKAFVSTTTDKNVIFGSSGDSSFTGGIVFHITSPPGTKIAGIPSNYPKEKEMLLGRGTAFRLDREEHGTDPNGDPLRILHVTVVGQH